MPYQTIQHFVRDFGFQSFLNLLELKNKGATDEQVARCLPASKRTGKKLSARRVSQLVCRCLSIKYLPNEIVEFYLQNMLVSEQGAVDWARKQIQEMKQESEEANGELLQFIPGGRGDTGVSRR